MTSTVLPSKPVPQLDSAGHFIGWATAWESPLEPGVWHIPAGAIDVLPPSAPPGQWPRWNGAAWELIPVPSIQAAQPAA